MKRKYVLQGKVDSVYWVDIREGGNYKVLRDVMRFLVTFNTIYTNYRIVLIENNNRRIDK